MMMAVAASAQTSGDVPPMSIRVTGEATVTAAPDRAEIDAAVVTRANTAQRAAADNARETTRVLAEMKKLVGTDGMTSTIGYSVRPEYRYPREGGEPEISGYVATNIVRVALSDLDRVGDAIDTAIGAGADRVQRIHFALKDEQGAYAQALHRAATRARLEADALASALGLKIMRVLSAVEVSAPPVRPLDTFRSVALAAESATTPVEPGTIDVQARVELTVEVSGVQP
jgi:uncharacterized protein YggE